MEANAIPHATLNSGHKMPLIGFGTASMRPIHDEIVSACLEAIKAGYRHFDTAVPYGTEVPLGRAVAQALESGLIKSRDELFISSKLWCNDAHRDLVLPALKNTLTRLGLEYVDLYLIHWPVRLKPDSGYLCQKEDVLPFDIEMTWEGMEECSKLGLAKSIGVSNFTCHKLSKILELGTIPPAVNQVEMNIAWRQQKLMKFCKEKEIHVSAYSPLGGNGTCWGTAAVMESLILKDIALAKGKTIAQVALRWIQQQGASTIVKSFNKERIVQNLEIFDWELNEEDLALINTIPQKRVGTGESYISPNGPYKSIEELWDGEDEA